MIPYGPDVSVYAAQCSLVALMMCVLVLPRKWAVFAWLLMANFDGTGSGLAVNSSVGWINTMKVLGAPLLVAIRFRGSRQKLIPAGMASLWAILTTYAALAALWSDYPLAAAKLVGNMLGIALMVWVLKRPAVYALITSKMIIQYVFATLALGLIQTLFFGVQEYAYDGYYAMFRLTSFVGPQQYAALLTALLSLVLWLKDIRRSARVCVGAVICIALLSNGSRTWAVGAILVLATYAVLAARRVLAIASAAILLVVIGGGLVAIATIGQSAGGVYRITAAIESLVPSDPYASAYGTATFAYRSAIYSTALKALAHPAGLAEVLFGHGTSSGGTVLVRTFPRAFGPDHVDPNRAIHNETLRVAYEWGCTGILLWAALLWVAGRFGLLIYRHRGAAGIANAYLCYAPAFFLGLSLENILAGGGNAVTLGGLTILVLAAQQVNTLRSTSSRPLEYIYPSEYSTMS